MCVRTKPGLHSESFYNKNMPTLNQIERVPRRARRRSSKSSILNKNPQRKGICRKVYTRSPKKPNSALRPVAKVGFRKGVHAIAHIPGEGHNLQQHSVVLIRGSCKGSSWCTL